MDKSKSLTDYNEDLAKLKKVFIGGGESVLIANKINDLFPSRSVVDWLDVGSGEGGQVRKMIKILNKKNVQLTAVDPILGDNPRFWRDADILHRCSFEEFRSNDKYDVINVSQSLYYMANKKVSIWRMINFLKKGGVLVITTWSNEDVLQKIHSRLFPASKSNITSEALIDMISAINSVYINSVEESRTGFNTFALSDEQVLKSALRVISRQELSDKNENDLLRIFKIELSKLNAVGPRVNKTLFVAKL